MIKLNKLKLFILVFIIFLGVGLTIYSNSFSNKFFWDDDDSIVNNEYIKDFKYFPNYFSENLIAGSGKVTNYWRPALLISFAIDYHLYGLNPVGFHVNNTILHIIVAFLLFVLLFELSKGNKYIAFLSALIFLIHPLQTEAITYVAGRADPLSSIFLLLSLIFYINFRKKKIKHKNYFLIISLISFFLGLLTKEQIILAPLLIVLIEGIFFFKKENWKKSFKILIPYFSLSIIYFVSRITFLNFNNILAGMDYMVNYNSSLWIRLLTFTWVFNKYIFLMFAPLNLHMAYEVSPILSFFSWPVLLFLIFISILFFFIFKNIKKEKMISFSLLWFFIILLPRTNIFKINRPLYEHWLYLPLAGFFFFLFSLVSVLIKKIERGKIKKIVKILSIILFVIFSIFLSHLTIQRNKDWKDPITFYEKNLKYTPNSFIQRNNLGMAYADEGYHDKAVKQYSRSIAIYDYYPQVHYNLANSLISLKNINEAKKEYQKAIKISPSFSYPYINLLKIYIEENKKEESLVLLKKLEENVPFEYYFDSALPIFLNFKEFDKAIEISEKMFKKYPNNMEIGLLLLKLKNNNISK